MAAIAGSIAHKVIQFEDWVPGGVAEGGKDAEVRIRCGRKVRRPDLVFNPRPGVWILGSIKPARQKWYDNGRDEYQKYRDCIKRTNPAAVVIPLRVPIPSSIMPFPNPGASEECGTQSFRVNPPDEWGTYGYYCFPTFREIRRRPGCKCWKRKKKGKEKEKGREKPKEEAKPKEEPRGKEKPKEEPKTPKPAAANVGIGISILSSGGGAANAGVGISIMSDGYSVGTVSAGIVYDSQGVAVGAVGAGAAMDSMSAGAATAGAGVVDESVGAAAASAGAGKAKGNLTAGAANAGAGTSEDVTGTAVATAGKGTAKNVQGHVRKQKGEGKAEDQQAGSGKPGGEEAAEE
ncbi:MAG TPA: hypothetical protein VFU47_17485, partial [Armatimonadota bacterium]|nr:hypothetical protein [Armatimonadota bacterium]